MSTALVAGNAAAAHWSGLEVTRQLGKTGQPGAAKQVSTVASLKSSRTSLRTKSRNLAGRSTVKPSVMVRADFLGNETSRPAVGETVSLRDVASDSEGGVGDLTASRNVSSEAAAEGGQTPQLHKTAKENAELSPLQESVEDIEAKVGEVASAVTQNSTDEIGDGSSQLGKKRESGRPFAFQDVELTEKERRDISSDAAAGRGSFPEQHTTAIDKVEDDGHAELPTVQEIGTEIVETIKDGIEQLKWSAENMMASGGKPRKSFQAAKEAIDKRVRGLTVAADEVREMGAQAAEIAQKGWGGFSEKVEVIQKEVSSLTEELQSSSGDLSKRAADGSEKSRSQILQTLNQAEERARVVGNQVAQVARQLGEEANEHGTKLGESAEKAIRDLQEQAKQVGNVVGEAAQNVQNRGARVSESSGNIIREVETLSKDLGKSGESEPNSKENLAERVQNQGSKVSTSSGNVLREVMNLWRDLLRSKKQRNMDQQSDVSKTDATEIDALD